MKVYLDNAATTPLDPELFEAMKPFMLEDFGNPSSTHSHGRKVRAAIEKDAQPDLVFEIVGSESFESHPPRIESAAARPTQHLV